MKRKWLALFVLVTVAGCASSAYQRDHDIEANLPRALGLGAFTPSCIFFCIATATYTHGDDTLEPNASEAPMHSKSSAQKGPKKPPPPKGPPP